MSPPCLALLFSAVPGWLWETWIFLGLCQLPRAGAVSHFVSSAEEERLGGWWESSVPWQGSPHSTLPVLHWQDPHPSGIPAEVAGVGEATLCPGGSTSHVTVLSTPVPPAGVWWVMAAGGSCLASPVCVFMMLLPGSGKCLLLPLCFQQR